ncbi:MAG: nitroreductase family protein [Armatimonadota bacterium]|nr:MAG: nitroreductase family protein [Armatimonadota bacterium]
MTCAVGLILSAIAVAEELKPIELPKPRTEGGMPLMEALKARQTNRSFSPQKLPEQVLSDLLWAACGVNRPDVGKRTAPSAMNWQEVDVYVALADGVYLYDTKAHRLEPVLADDLRVMTGTQGFVKDVPVNLVYVADLARMKGASDRDKVFYSAADTGFIAQNVYLYCASEGLATVVRGLVNRPALKDAFNLRPDQEVILAQSVGYPKESE